MTARAASTASGGGGLPLPCWKPQQRTSGRDGDVERAFGLRVQTARALQQCEDLRRDAHGFACRPRVDVGDLAVRPEEAEAVLELLDLRQRLLARGAQGDRSFSPCSTISKRVAIALRARVTVVMVMAANKNGFRGR